MLSPYLFNIYTEFIFRESNDLQGICIHGMNVNNLRYADDTALIADDPQKLQEIVNKVKAESSRAGLDMNVKKTKTMVISRRPGEKKLEITVDGVILEMVDIFKYLGTLIKDNGKIESEIEARTKLAKSQFSSMSKTFTSKRLKMKTKIRILKCYIFSIFTYGSEAWSLSKVLEQKIEAVEMWCYRWMGNISWKDKIRNENVLLKLGTKRTLLKDIQKRKLRYYGHIKRKNNILTTAVEGRMRGKRPRGRPRINWFTDVKEWTGLTAAECTRRAANRNLWSVITSQPSQRR